MLKNGFITWILAVATGAVVMVAIEWTFRTAAPLDRIAPIAQGIAFWAAALVAWPYYRQQSETRWRGNFGYYSATFASVAIVIAALRLVFRTG